MGGGWDASWHHRSRSIFVEAFKRSGCRKLKIVREERMSERMEEEMGHRVVEVWSTVEV